MCGKNTVTASKTAFGDPCPRASKTLLVLVKAATGVQLFCPGIVVWIHRRNGTLQAADVPCDLDSIRRIICDKRLVADHSKFAYHRALLSVRAQRSCPRSLRWQSFEDAGDHCPCCHSEFDWMSTARSRKQRPLSMTNCRACGLVVCVNCASTRQAIPELGVLDAARICDCCSWGGGPEGSRARLQDLPQAFAAAQRAQK
ncbi:unnamed protein product [Polarella glacialis]|uniref:FYVE-type domain-containing protein n=1 Tax=Polarella glacialis TaxID=89957 RepID=A0A813DLR6_POLGL|nr:unnamed protein product [Polarella glacialis]